MRVKILQGNDTGLVQDVCQSEGENMLTTGFAELAPLDVPPPVAELAPPVAEPEGGSLAEPDESDDVSGDPAEPESVPTARVRRPRQAKKAIPSTSRRKRR